MLIPTKDGDLEIPQDWISLWNEVYYDVPKTLEDIRLWCFDNAQKRKTKRGLRSFIGRWIRKSCIKRPMSVVDRPLGSPHRAPQETMALSERLGYLSQLKAMVGK